MWKRLSSKVIFEHPRLTLVEDKVALPDGTKTDYLRFEIKGNSATVICRDKKGKILLIKEYSYLPNKKIYKFPGGFVPRGKSIKRQANKELMEEVGLRAKNLTLLGSYWRNHRRSKALGYVYLGTELGEKSLEGDIEEGEIEKVWFTEKGIENLIKEGRIIEDDALACWSIYKSTKKRPAPPKRK